MRNRHLTVCGVALLSYFPAIVSKYKIFYIAIFLVFLWTWSLGSRGYLDRKGARKDGSWVFVFFTYLLLTAFWAEYTLNTLLAVAINSIFLLVWGLSYFLVRNYPVARIAKVFVALPFVVAGIFIYMYARFGTIRPYDETSMASIGATGNAAGIWLGTTLPFILWLVGQKEKNSRIALCLSLFLIALSASRAGYVLAVLALGTHVVLNGKSLWQRFVAALKVVAIGLAVLALAFYLPLTRDLVAEGIQRITADQLVASSEGPGGGADADAVVDAERLWMLEEGLEAFTEHPLLGIGYDNISKRIEEVHGVPITSHNILLTLIVECGWPGFLIFIVLIFVFFKRVWYARRNLVGADRGFYSACAISMICALLSGMFHPLLGFPPFYILLGFGYGAMRSQSFVVRNWVGARGLLLDPEPA